MIRPNAQQGLKNLALEFWAHPNLISQIPRKADPPDIGGGHGHIHFRKIHEAHLRHIRGNLRKDVARLWPCNMQPAKAQTDHFNGDVFGAQFLGLEPTGIEIFSHARAKQHISLRI